MFLTCSQTGSPRVSQSHSQTLAKVSLGRAVVHWFADGRLVARAKIQIVLAPDGFLECQDLPRRRVLAGLVGWASRVSSHGEVHL